MNLETDLGFDLYGRYAIMRDIINETRLKQNKFKILDVGGRGNLLKLFLPNDDVFYLDPNIDSEDSNFIKADGCDLPFENDSFDWVVSADVLEHIPENKRNIFIDEQHRVCKYGFIVAAPFHSQIVVDAEISINNRFNELFGTDHPWLIEHIQNGLPDISFLTEYARKNKIKLDVFHNNEIHLWELSYNLIFLKDLNPVIDLSNFTEYYNKNYKTELAQKDSYRKILVFQKQYKHEFYKNEINADFSVFMQNIIRIVNDEQTNSFKNNSLTISNLNNQIQNFNQRKNYFSQLYYSTNNDFSENLSLKIDVQKGAQYLFFDVSGFENPSFFRFDPANIECTFVLENIELNYEDGIEYVNFNSTNACFVDGKVHYFTSEDPNIFINTDSSRKLLSFIVRCNYLEFEKPSFHNLIRILNENSKNNFIDFSDLQNLKKELVDNFFHLHNKNSSSKNFKSLESNIRNLTKLTLENFSVLKKDNIEIKKYNERFDELVVLQKHISEKTYLLENLLSSLSDFTKEIQDEIGRNNNNLVDNNKIFLDKINEITKSNSEFENNINTTLAKLNNNILEINPKIKDLETGFEDNLLQTKNLVTELGEKLSKNVADLESNVENYLSALKTSSDNNFLDINEKIAGNFLELNILLKEYNESNDKSLNDNYNNIKELFNYQSHKSIDENNKILQSISEKHKQDMNLHTDLLSKLEKISDFNEIVITNANNELRLLQNRYEYLLNDIRSSFLLRKVLKKHL